MNYSERSRIKIGLVLISLIWGSTWLAIKIGLDSVPPISGIVIRFLVALIVLYGVIRWRGLAIPRDRPTWNLFISIGVLSFSVPFAMIYWAAQFIPTGLMSILFAVYPFVIAILSHLFLPSERVTAFKIGGIVLGFGGILLIFSQGLHWEDQFVLMGMIAVLFSTILQGISLILIKKYGEEINPLMMNFGGMLVGAIVLFLGAWVFERGIPIVMDAKAIGSILYLGTFGSVVTFAVYFWLLKRVEILYLSLISFVTPIVAVVLGSIFLDEVLGSNTFIGAGLVLGGLLLANARSSANLTSRLNESEIH